MIARAFLIENNQVLMVNQYAGRGAVIWTFPGGGVEVGETIEEACIREVKEETGYEVRINRILEKSHESCTFIVERVGGNLSVDKQTPENDDLIAAEWVSVDDKVKWDHITQPLLYLYQTSVQRS